MATLVPGGTGISVQWTAMLVPEHSGVYRFIIEGSNCTQLFIDGQKRIDIWGNPTPVFGECSVELTEGVAVKLFVRMNRKADFATARLTWLPPSASISEDSNHFEALEHAASQADAVIFLGGHSHVEDREGTDMSDMELHFGQNEVIEVLLSASPNTAIVLFGGGPMAMPWAERAHAIMFAGYPGMESGNAVAATLFGEVSPSGKLPVTFPRKLEDSPAHALDAYCGQRCVYEEGVYVGYRYYDSFAKEPLFPFGHGLSYTSFGYSSLSLSMKSNQEIVCEVGCLVRNAGSRAGAEVVQCYVAPCAAPVARPAKELKGFTKVLLQPGEERLLRIDLDRRAFAYWDEGVFGWKVAAGDYEILVGSSSRDIRLRGTITIQSTTVLS